MITSGLLLYADLLVEKMVREEFSKNLILIVLRLYYFFKHIIF